jgi:hypothetical protein
LHRSAIISFERNLFQNFKESKSLSLDIYTSILKLFEVLKFRKIIEEVYSCENGEEKFDELEKYSVW